MTTKKWEKVCSLLTESIESDPEIDVPEMIGDEWADPEEFLNFSGMDDVAAQILTRKRL